MIFFWDLIQTEGGHPPKLPLSPAPPLSPPPGHYPSLTSHTQPTALGSTSTSDDDNLSIPEITVRQLKSGSMFLVPVQIQDQHTTAVVDTAAEVTIISDTFYKTLSQKPEKKQDIKLRTAGRDLHMSSFQRVEFLGRVVSQDGLEANNDGLKVVLTWPHPTCTKDVERFLGFANYHRMFIRDYASMAVLLYRITGKKAFQWNDEQEQSFSSLRHALTHTPVLALPTKEDPFILDTDASDEAIGAELIQVQNGEERVVCFGSFGLTAEQKRYCTTRKELLAVIRFTRQFRHYLLGRRFTVRTDHSSLQWLLNSRNPNSQLARCLEELSQYDLMVKHRPGKLHTNADSLSRIPQGGHCHNYRPEVMLKSLPCGGCKYCTRAHENWSRFFRDVDDTIPLAHVGRDCLSDDDSPDDCGLPVSCLEIQSIGDSGFQMNTTPVPVRLVVTDDGQKEQFGYSSEEICNQQRSDPDLTIIMDWIQTAEEPSESSLFLASPAAKHYWLNRTLFQIDKQGLLRVDPLIKEKTTRGMASLVVPKSLQQEVLRLNHDVMAAAHLGMEKTIYRVKTRFYWHGMVQDIKLYVSTCSTCSRNKGPVRHARSPMINFHAGAPMERVHLDFIGPLPKSKLGNQYILMMVDQFTKWVECIALPTQTAEVTAKAAVDVFFSRFGCPFKVFTDQGRNFESKLFTELCTLLQIHKTRTTPYRPSANGQVERFNRTLLQAIRCHIDANQSRWDEFLPQLAGALRSAVNRQTGYTANMLMLGREINQPAELVFSATQEESPSLNPDTYVHQLASALGEVHRFARNKLQTTQLQMKRDYDLRILSPKFEEGEMVYILDTASIQGKCKKLSPSWKGPGIITTRISNTLYEVRTRKTTSVHHHDRLKPCRDRVIPSWIQRLSKTKSTSDTQEDLNLEWLFKKQRNYCICNKPDDGRLMIGCDRCDQWFHGACVGITKRTANALDEYICPHCTTGKDRVS
ncbi:uncharacterized protein LOC125375886 [Haliotis rufescens]|uniref:uncharacterized protein LOC125375886 n=1 Tax=Haliotis rufescens TaxID=6454 RepID=UPI00201F000A|nr:uncharacterized protein LOC125375886 [Haliotis rufescens]